MAASRILLDIVTATTLVALLAWVVGITLRRASPTLRHSLWRAALLAFWIVPLAVVSVDALHLSVCPIPVRTGAPRTPPALTGRIGGRYGERSPASTSSEAAASASRPAPGPRLLPVPPLQTALALWAAGIALAGIALARKLRGLNRLLRTASSLDDPALSQSVLRWCAQMAIRRPPLLAESSSLSVPTVAGWRPAVLLLPPGFSARDAGCDAVLVHELAHIRRRDLAVQAIARATRALWWWHPLSWIAAKELSVTAEEACDDWAVSLTEVPQRYADHIVRWSEAAHASGTLACACRGRDLARRVRRLLAQSGAPEPRPSSRARAGLILCALIAISGAAVIRAQPADTKLETNKEDGTVTASASGLTYGFRYDPMTFVANDDSRQGALVRTFVFQQPHEGDADIIQKWFEEILAEQRGDGSFADTAKDTGAKLLNLLRIGFPHDRPEVSRAVEAIIQQKRAAKETKVDFLTGSPLAVYPLEALCLLGRTDIPEVKDSLTWYVEHPEEWNDPWKGCPWTPEVFWTALWAGRDLVDTVPIINQGLQRVMDDMNDAGCSAYNFPYGFVDAAGQIALPAARSLVEKQIPMILRGQRPDGGWGNESFIVFRALKAHGFLDKLRSLPPLPPDWKIVRSIPAPGADLWTMAWDGERLWVYDRTDNSATAISPEDGKVLKKLTLPVDNVYGIGWWDGFLAVTQEDPKMLLQVDADTAEINQDITIDKGDWVWVGAANQVNGKVWVADRFSPGIIVMDKADTDKREFKILAGPGPETFAATPNGVWHADFWTPAIIKTSYDGKLLDWGDQVFDRGTAGLAFDGENLWALDGVNRRICIIEKSHQQPAS
ncbi:MAG: hypothetical protein JSV79_03535 [Armatimonadota bacterium]|nr:MAG: hypothetical protein JSV79_03535 [Armatimonadota bacterium]